MTQPAVRSAVRVTRNRLLCFLTRLAMLVVMNGVSWLPLAARSAGVNFGNLNPAIPEIDAGEQLLNELNCVACHQAGPNIRFRARPSPKLGEHGLRITPQYLRAFLTEPQREVPGTPMPDLLHGLDALQKADNVDALVHYLVSLSPTNTPAPMGADVFKIRQGRLLYHRIGCVACHAPQEPADALEAKSSSSGDSARTQVGSTELAALKESSVPLGNLARKTTVVELARFLMDPLRVRPGGRMPSLNLSEDEAKAIAMYLLRDQSGSADDPSRPPQKIQGLNYQYYEAEFSNLASFDNLQVADSGFVDNFTIAPARRHDDIGFRFTGYITVSADGNYTFYTSSDDGSRLYIGETLVVNNDGDHGETERKGSIQLKKGDHPILVGWFNGGGDAALKVFYEGPGLAKQPIPNSALSRLGRPMVPLGQTDFVVSPEKAVRGRELFRSLGCAACHQINNELPSALPTAGPLANLLAAKEDGCLGDQIAKGVPDFHLSTTQRTALRSTLAHVNTLGEPADPKQQVLRTMMALNCFACHARDAFGGPGPERAAYFVVKDNVDMGDEGRLPPNLRNVGAKLRTDWIRELLLNKGAVRPYMATRMPQFGEANVGQLPAAFERADALANAHEPPDFSITAGKFGRKLVGTGGLSCVSCHTFADFKSLGIPAIDLTQMARRLKYDWFRRYLLDPQLLRPGTRMPGFWPEGKSANQDIFGGDVGQQIDAIWSYLSKGRKADVPDGLVRGRMELVPQHEALIYRNFIAGAGSRAIGVGYPEKSNLAFDANEVRLALIWQGAFIDAARHRTGRGEGFEPPLGNNVVKMPPGAPFAILPDTKAAWPTAVGKKAGYQMRGYRLDAKRRPTFLYSFGQIEIEDYSLPVTGELDTGFWRTLKLRTTQPVAGLWYRAGIGTKIETRPDGSYLVDDKVSLKFNSAENPHPLVRQIGGHSELLLPVVFENPVATIVESIVW